jgi:cytolysin (calcineurin-like family phosphatase)
MIERTKTRPRVSHVSSNGLHYSWDVGDVHFVNLGIVVGSVKGISRRRRYAPRQSLEFLVKDLEEKVGDSGRPVIITHHVDIARYTTPVPDDAPFSDKEWDPADLGGFHAALCGYNVAGIFYGHTHARNVWRWDGISAKPAGARLNDEAMNALERRSLNVFNVDNSAHFQGMQQAFFYVECSPDGLAVREYATNDAWETGAWSPLVWSRAGVAAGWWP